MSKYKSLWEYIKSSKKDSLVLSFDDINKISGKPIDHSFLMYKKELINFDYTVSHISIKNKTVLFCKKG